MAKKSSVFGLILIFTIATVGIIAGGSIIAKAISMQESTETIKTDNSTQGSSDQNNKDGINLGVEKIVF